MVNNIKPAITVIAGFMSFLLWLHLEYQLVFRTDLNYRYVYETNWDIQSFALSVWLYK